MDQPIDIYRYIAGGFTHILIDDGWSTCAERDDKFYCKNASGGRDAHGRIVADPGMFPSGMKSTVDYVHSLGLRFGIYT